MDKQMIEEMANGYAVVNGKIIYFSNMLDKYRNEFKDLEEVVEEMNGLMKQNDSYMAQIEYWKHKAEEKIPENAVVLTKEEYERLYKLEYDNAKLRNVMGFYDQTTDADLDDIDENIKKFYSKARKETAEKFAEKAKAKAIRARVNIDDNPRNDSFIFLSDIDEICKEIKEGQNDA